MGEMMNCLRAILIASLLAGGSACGRGGFEAIDGGETPGCPLGSDETTSACHTASNIPDDCFAEELGDLDFSGAGSPVIIDSDNGEILSPTGVIRPAGTNDSNTSTIFQATTQEDGSGLGVLSMRNFTLPVGVEVQVTGGIAFAIAATGDVQIDGTLDVGAQGVDPGPGGFAGGAPGFAGEGACGGSLGQGTNICPDLCASGGGGGGHGGLGGEGGAVNYSANLTNGPITYGETPGGGLCGSPSLIPLMGGPGGAGGAFAEGYANSLPGRGGAGGGAIQISAASSIRIGAQGIITAAGQGGAETISGGGTGGGAGGAILLESPSVLIDSSAILAANGGGGGGGDCT